MCSAGCRYLCATRQSTSITLSSISAREFCLHSRNTGTNRISHHKTRLAVGMLLMKSLSLINTNQYFQVGIGAAIIAFSFIFFSIISHTGAHLDRIQHQEDDYQHKVALHFGDNGKIPVIEEVDLLDASVC